MVFRCSLRYTEHFQKMLFRQFSETVLYSDHFQMNLKKNDCKVQMVFSYSRNFRCTMLAHLPKTAIFSEVSHGTQWYSVCFWMQFRRKTSHSVLVHEQQSYKILRIWVRLEVVSKTLHVCLFQILIMRTGSCNPPPPLTLMFFHTVDIKGPPIVYYSFIGAA